MSFGVFKALHYFQHLHSCSLLCLCCHLLVLLSAFLNYLPLSLPSISLKPKQQSLCLYQVGSESWPQNRPPQDAALFLLDGGPPGEVGQVQVHSMLPVGQRRRNDNTRDPYGEETQSWALLGRCLKWRGVSGQVIHLMAFVPVIRLLHVDLEEPLRT